MSLWKNLWPTLVALGVAVGTSAAPSLQHSISNHPTLSAILGSTLTVVAHWLPSPKEQQ